MFAFANAGVSLQGMSLAALADPITLGIVCGLVLGKALGVFGTAWVFIQLGWAKPPAQASWGALFGVCVLCGIGFTMSLFIGDLAFANLDEGFDTRVKLGVLTGSVLAGALGALVLLRCAKQGRHQA